MKKVFLQAAFLLILFFGSWYILAQIDWMKILKIEHISNKTQTKIGNIIWASIEENEYVYDDPFVVKTMDSLVNHLKSNNYFEIEDIKLHVISKEEKNAYALPDGHIIIYSELIQLADAPEEILAVIAHEIAHIQLGHVAQKFKKELAINSILSVSAGKANSEIFREAAKVISSKAFDRSYEKQADLQAIEYLNNAKVNPEALITILEKLKNSDFSTHFEWINSHPNVENRSYYIRDHINTLIKPTGYLNIIHTNSWQILQNSI